MLHTWLSLPSRARLLKLAQNGQVLIAAGQYWVQLLDAKDGTRMRRFDSAQLRCLAVSPDSARLAMGSYRGGLVVQDMQSERRLFEQSAYSSVTALAFSPDGRELAVAGQRKDMTNDVTIWQQP